MPAWCRYESTLKDLRRQVGNCRSYDNVMSETAIVRLKKEIQVGREGPPYADS